MDVKCGVIILHQPLKKVHLYFLKRILKVRKGTVNNMVYCEMGRLP